MLRINIEADKVWDLFQEKKSRLRTDFYEIATDPDLDIVIYLTSVGESGEFSPDIIVCVDGEVFYEDSCWDEEDCATCVSQIYEKMSKIKEKPDVTETDEEALQEMEIEDRENAIDAALYDFLDVALDGDIDSFPKARTEDFFEDCKEHFLEYLARKWEADIRRPMILVDPDGNESYEEYPYDLLEFEDEDNPIYII